MLNNSLYGNYRQKKFADVYGSQDEFRSGWQEFGFPDTFKNSGTLDTIYLLLYSYYGNSTIASSDINQFKARLFSIVYMYGPAWETRREIQDSVRNLNLDELREGTIAIFNHANNPSTEPQTDAFSPLSYINEQNANGFKKSKIDAYASLWEMVKTDVTKEFINRFATLFLKVVMPEEPLWYITETEDI